MKTSKRDLNTRANNMMISPEDYVDQLQDATYDELIKERDSLIRLIRRFEDLKNWKYHIFT